MSYLDKLLEGAEVEWKALDMVFDIFAGGDVPKEALSEIETEEFNIPILSNGIDKKSLYGWTNIPKIEKPSLTISARGTIGWTSYRDKPFFPIVRLLVLTPKGELNLKFAYYYMKTIEDKYNVPQNGIPQLTKPMVKDILFPIPCLDNPTKSLEIQKEIVRILDTFTERTEILINELTTELEARKRQYNYYREKLLSFEEGEVEWKTLGEVGELVRGNGLPKTDFTVNGVPAIHYGQIYTFYGTYTENTISFVSKETAKKLSKVERGDVVITNTSENFEDVGKAVVYLGEEQAVTGGHATIFKPSKVITGKYFAYFTQTSHFSSQKRKYAKGTKVIDVSAKDMAKIMIPIPQKEEQERIVTILDKLESLTTSISEALPKEIALRKKQYEYYRDLLLPFPTDNLKA
jgi:type I restriction enzyme S subunit